jgi:hypothetical protein
MNSFFYCPKCAWSLEPGAACKPECPECGARLHIGKVKKNSPITISPSQSRKRFPTSHPLIARVSDGMLFVLQEDGMYVQWDSDPKFREPQCYQARYDYNHLREPHFKVL